MTPGPGGRNAFIRLILRGITAGFFLVAATLLLGRYWVTLDWPSTLGTVERITYRTVGDPDDSRAPGERFRPEIEVTYTVDGESYRGGTLTVFDWVYRSRERAVQYVERFGIRSGERVPIYYDPENPSRSVVIRHFPWFRVEVILGVLLLIVLPVGVVLFSIFENS